MAGETRRRNNSAGKSSEGRNSRLKRKTVKQKSGCNGVLILALAMLMSWTCPAQTQTSVISGQVTDPSGAAMVGATLLLTTPSGASMDTTTNREGVYEFKNLAPGNYEIKAVAAGFAMFDKPGILLAPGQTLRIDILLTLEIEKEK